MSERRFINREVRQKTDKENIIESYGAVFDQWSEVLNSWFVEIVRPGCFSESIINDDIRALKNHDPNLILGRNTAGTLLLQEDITGLRYEIDLPATTYANDLKISVERRDITQNSFSFKVLEDRWGTKNIGGVTYEARELIKVKLYDLGPVTFPAYTATDGILLRNFIQNSPLNLEEVQGVIQKAHLKKDLKSGERKLLTDTIKLLSSYAGDESEQPENPENRAVSIDLLRRKLDLLTV